MKIIGNITKSAGKYTASVFVDGVCVYRHKSVPDLSLAQAKIKRIKSKLMECQDYIKSFPELDDKIVNWKNGDLKFKARIIGCDFWIGVTMVRARDKTRYSTCVRGPLAPQTKELFSKGNFEEWGENYITNFKNIVKALQAGSYSVQQVYGRPSRRGGTGPTAESCAFGQ